MMVSNHVLCQCGSLAVAGALLFAGGARAGDDESESQIRRGFQIVPAGVHLNLKGKNRALVGLGSYIVNTTGCNDCHTIPSSCRAAIRFSGSWR